MKFAVQIQHDENMDLALRCAKEAGFEYVALGFGSSKLFHSDEWERGVSEISAKLDALQLKCIQTHLPYYDLRLSAEKTDPALDLAMLRCARASAMLGADWTAYHARTALDGEYNLAAEVSLGYAKEAIKPLLDEAQRVGVTLAVENLPVFTGIRGMKFFSWDYHHLLALCEHFGRDHFGVCWDFGHAHYTMIDQPEAFSALGDRIVATHVHNNEAFTDSHMLPSQGTIDWKTVMGAFGKCGYDNALTLEINYKPTRTLTSYFAHALDCLEELQSFMI